MAFIKLTPTDTRWLAVHVDFERKIAIWVEPGHARIEELGALHVVKVTETPDAILAAIADASGGAVDEADRVSGTMLRAALDVFQRAKIPVPSTLVLEDAIAAALRARQP